MVSQTVSDPYAKGGIMVRDTSDPGSPYYAVYLSPNNGILVQSRDASGDNSVQEASIATGTAPAYLQITRTGTTFAAATSADGVTWTPIPGATVSLPNLSGAVLEGLAVTSHNTGALSTAVFNSVVTS